MNTLLFINIPDSIGFKRAVPKNRIFVDKYDGFWGSNYKSIIVVKIDLVSVFKNYFL